MKNLIISKIKESMSRYLSCEQLHILNDVLINCLLGVELITCDVVCEDCTAQNENSLNLFLSSKRVEGCSERTIQYYQSTLKEMLKNINKDVKNISTDDLRNYLATKQSTSNLSKVTTDNIRRVISSFFTWLEDEDYIIKSPARRIHKIKTTKTVKETFTDENLEKLRDACNCTRDLAIVDMLASTGMRIGELVRLDITDINFSERECVVLGKGDKERLVYFDARTKIHLKNYLENRKDGNPALFVSLNAPFERLNIGGVEQRLRYLGKKANVDKVHPHKFRRTMATMAIDKGMPIEQVQSLLGHVKIDTTMKYAMVKQTNVKMSHRKYIS